MDTATSIFISWFPLLLLIFIFWGIPILVISSSKKVGRSEKLAWIIATLFISWACLLLYLLLAPLKPNDD